MAERAEEQAAKIFAQHNWPAAARAWQVAVDHSSLLNDLGGEAVALHNLAQTERELAQDAEAQKHLEQAARLNEKLGRASEWWRNQIALLQLEAQFKETAPLKNRFAKLFPLAPALHDRSIQALFLNEVGLWQKSQGEAAKAEKAFAEAEQNFKAVKDSVGLATISANRAELYEEQKNYSAAIAAWKEALAGFQALADPPHITQSLLGEGRTLLTANVDLPAAEDLLRRAARNYQLLQKPQKAQAALVLLARCLAAEGKEAESAGQGLP